MSNEKVIYTFFKFVTNLSCADFKLLEGGVTVQITSLNGIRMALKSAQETGL